MVDTIHVKEATITNNGLEHSDRVHVIERFKLSADGKKLLATQEFEDPVMLKNKGIRFITWNQQATCSPCLLIATVKPAMPVYAAV